MNTNPDPQATETEKPASDNLEALVRMIGEFLPVIERSKNLAADTKHFLDNLKAKLAENADKSGKYSEYKDQLERQNDELRDEATEAKTKLDAAVKNLEEIQG